MVAPVVAETSVGAAVTASAVSATAAHTAAKALSQRCVDSPLHSACINGLRLKHRAFAGTVRVTLQWLAANMFGDHISQEAVELLVAVSAFPSHSPHPT
jgi:hypothetical protein